MGLGLEISGIAKAYHGHPVLTDCTGTFAGGRTYVLQGPNGSGKSTLFRILALLEKPDTGNIRYRQDGVILPDDLQLRRQITLVLPRTGIFNSTVFHNVAYGLTIRNMGAGEIEQRVTDILVTVGLAHKRRHRALDLSSGETKRLGIARAMVVHPQVLLLDEPTANLDPENTEIIENIMITLRNQRKATILLITHDPAQAGRLGDDLLIMERGRLNSP